MSYLGYPRLNFAGTFQADVPTVNNTLQYYEINTFEPRFQWLTTDVDRFGEWNPRGTGSCRLTDIRITSACLPDGRMVTSRSDDVVAEGRLADDNLRTSARFVDMDPENQFVSTIFGLRPRILDATGAELVRGDFVPVAVDDIWLRTVTPQGPSPAAMYQSVLRDLTWADSPGSPVMRALREATQDGMLSIKFNVDGVVQRVPDADYPGAVTFGRMVGSLGPYLAGEPWRILAARRLRKANANSPLFDAPCRVDEKSGLVFVDLGNSVMATTPGGPLAEVGALRLAALAADGTPQVLAPLDGIDATFYERLAGIVTAKLTPEQLAAVARTRLAVVTADAKPAILLAENEGATTVHAEESVFRLSPSAPDNTATTTLLAMSHGRPAAGVELYIRPSELPSGDPEPRPPLDVPARVRTDANGRAQVKLTASDPGHPRPGLDGVALLNFYGLAERPDEPEGVLSTLVFDDYEVPARPTWARDVQPIFQRYANLYPAMGDVFDLGNYHQVVAHALYIKKALLAPVESPNHMPVTRDLSPRKRDMLVKWLDTQPAPPVLEIDTVEDLRAALQQAALLEQATVPPYLSALYSIMPGHNVAIGEIIRGIVLEEMQHMAQACNLLNAVGGHPVIGRPGLVPTYPGRLPGPVLPDLRVRLRRLSIDHVRDVFMAIEQPEYPTVDGTEFRGAVIDPAQVTTDRAGNVMAAEDSAIRTLTDWFVKAEHKPLTIGWFYTQIARALIRLNGKGTLFTGDPALQVSWPGAPGTLYRVTDLRSALLAVYQIIEQGEGSPHDPEVSEKITSADEFGHYYRFEEIVRGRALIKNAQGKWVFEGDPIPFDPSGVYPMADDPDTYRLPANSAERRESQAFDTVYTNILTALNRVVNGHPGEFDNTVGLMYQAEVQAKKLLAMPVSKGASTVLGAAFQSPAPGFPN
ncbi:ferritin-like domain-containing protein [Amycolatopsis rhizosphaerae]|uniref:ferritin-like domain-containing protein n=1 Tax=Amycolatopsis rhizosphaerae TaxID=2053003 RepID=UPI001643EB2D|nr:ferritin-like protein [Amycolatopsis rhizosphaerae]